MPDERWIEEAEKLSAIEGSCNRTCHDIRCLSDSEHLCHDCFCPVVSKYRKEKITQALQEAFEVGQRRDFSLTEWKPTVTIGKEQP